MTWSVDHFYDEIGILARRGIPRQRLFAELTPRLSRVIGNDAMCWHTLDPQTRLMTSDAPEDLVHRGIYTTEASAAAGALLLRSEYLMPDFNTFASLAGRRLPVATLEQATRGHPERSLRHRELLMPSEIPHELRAAFVVRGRPWGAVHIARRRSSGPFTERDVRALASVGGVIAMAIRSSLRFDAARRGTGGEPPGLIVLDAHDEVELITHPARQLLEAIRCETQSDSGATLPSAIVALARRVRDGDLSAVTIPSDLGWVTLHASLPDGRTQERVAIVIEHATGTQLATLRLEVHGVTPREREVATLVARGLSNLNIARCLVVSPHTVEDHLSSLFEKLGVSSRQELVARVFLDEYMPGVIQRTALTTRGRFEPRGGRREAPAAEPALR